MPEDQKDLSAQMHSETRREIADIKERATRELAQFLALTSEVKSVSNKLDHLDERLNEGVSKTAFKTFEKVQEIAVTITNIKHDNDKRDLRIANIKEEVKTNRDNQRITLKWILGISSLALFTALSLTVWIIRRGGLG